MSAEADNIDNIAEIKHSTTYQTYLFCQYFAVLLNTIAFLKYAKVPDALTAAFMAAATVGYASAYWMILVLINIAAASLMLKGPKQAESPEKKLTGRTTARAVIAISTFSALHVLLHLDRFVFGVFGFHINSFVINLLTTPGGAESMDVGGSAKITFTVIIAAIITANIALWFFSIWLSKRRRPISVKKLAIAAAIFIICAISQAFGYGLAKVYANRPIMRSAQVLPWFQPVSISSLARKFGLNPVEIEIKKVDNDILLDYPKQPLGEITRPMNIVWLVGESWRFDMLSEEISPNIWNFANENAAIFTNHYSSGVNTRMGMFGMFYGLHGNYWFSMLSARRSPVLIDALQKSGYDFLFRSSSRFTYPEFTQTILTNIDSSDIFERDRNVPGWDLDRSNVDQICQWLNERKNSGNIKPFMAFMFFESPHAGYHFPAEAEIRSNYKKDFNYATDLRDDPGKDFQKSIFNRYVNASYHMDMQVGRILDNLRLNGLLDNTIVIITGDHGEEFYENGRWGHGGSDFHQWQMRVPLIIHSPDGPKGSFDGHTSHIDLPATVLGALGVKTEPNMYGLGKNLLTGEVDHETIIATAWDMMMCRTDGGKVIFPFRTTGLTSCAGADDSPAEDEGAILKKLAQQLGRTVRQMQQFSK